MQEKPKWTTATRERSEFDRIAFDRKLLDRKSIGLINQINMNFSYVCLEFERQNSSSSCLTVTIKIQS